MGSTIWVSGAYFDDDLNVDFVTLPVRHRLSSVRYRDEDVSLMKLHNSGYKRNGRGLPIDPSAVPEQYFWNAEHKPLPIELPPLIAAGHMLIREDVAEVFGRHNLGEARLQKVHFFDFEMNEIEEFSAYTLLFQNLRQCVNLKASQVVRVWEHEEIFLPDPDVTLEDTLAAKPDIVDGPAVWVDPHIWRVFFVSEELGRDLAKAGFAEAMRLVEVRG